MTIAKGISEIERAIEQRRSSTGEKARWLKLDDGQQVRIRVISEFSADSPFYSEERGLAILVPEHTNPKDWRRKAVCTRDDAGRCVGCEQAKLHPKTGWASKQRLYVNALVTPKKEDPYVAIWSMGIAKSPTFATLKAVYDVSGSVSNIDFTLSRQGEKTETTYVMLPGMADAVKFDWDGIEAYDLERVAIREIAYEDQTNFYFGIESGSEQSSASDAW